MGSRDAAKLWPKANALQVARGFADLETLHGRSQDPISRQRGA
jgi:hypothetical protein